VSAVTRDHDDAPKRRKKRGPAPKERVLHTRVPAVLEGELKKLATNLRVPVSNVVRAILEDAIDAVDNVTERAEGGLMGFVDRLSKQREDLRDKVRGEQEEELDETCPDRSDVLDGVFGYQPLVLAAETPCSVCGRMLSAGDDAHRALFDDAGKRVILGPDCRLLPEKE
jgi:hypothetical protein